MNSKQQDRDEAVINISLTITLSYLVSFATAIK